MDTAVEAAPSLDGKQRLRAAYEEDPRHDTKLLLAGGSLHDTDGQALHMQSVAEAERRMYLPALQNTHPSTSNIPSVPSKRYLPIPGSTDFRKAVQELLWGEQAQGDHTARLRTLQTPGGTAALRLAGETIRRVSVAHEKATVWMSSPTWGNHLLIFQEVGFSVRRFPYRAVPSGPVALDFQALLDGIEEAQRGDVLLMQANCHNPTGLDVTSSQWQQLYEWTQERGVFLVLDMAFVGMAHGLQADLEPFRRLLERNEASSMPWFFAVSYSKCFALYNERVGSLTLIGAHRDQADLLYSHATLCARASYSNPPAHGAALVTAILTQPDLRAQWLAELDGVVQNLHDRRRQFVEALERASPLTEEQRRRVMDRHTLFMDSLLSEADSIRRLRREEGLYMNTGGLFNILTLPATHMDRVCELFTRYRETRLVE